MPRDRDTEGETVEECQHNLDGIREAEHHFEIAERALRVALEGYLSNVADESHQWFDPIGQPVHEFAAQALQRIEHAQRQLATFKLMWEGRMDAAQDVI